MTGGSLPLYLDLRTAHDVDLNALLEKIPMN
jgi:hypothetical protein